VSLSEKAFLASGTTAAAAFAAACVVSGVWVLLPVPLAAVGAWLLSRRPRWSPLGGMGFAVLMCGSGVGLLAGLSPLLMLGVALAGVSAWDMGSLSHAARGASDPGSARRVEKAHLVRLLIILGAGALLGSAAILLRRPLGFAALLCVGVLLAISLGVLLRSLGKGST
jgi:hypothetical protein